MICNLLVFQFASPLPNPPPVSCTVTQVSMVRRSNPGEQYATGMCRYHDMTGWRNSFYNGSHATSTSPSVCGAKSCSNLSCSALGGPVGHILIQKQGKERKEYFFLFPFLLPWEPTHTRRVGNAILRWGLCFTLRQVSPVFKTKENIFFLLLLTLPATVQAFPALSAALNKRTKHKLMLAAKFRSPKRYWENSSVCQLLVNTILQRRKSQTPLSTPPPTSFSFLLFFFLFLFLFFLSFFLSFLLFFLVRGVMKRSKTCASQTAELSPQPASHPTIRHKPTLSCTCPQKVCLSLHLCGKSCSLICWGVLQCRCRVAGSPPFLRLINDCFWTNRQ